ncbi:MAG TPA: hypothetical protein V6C85_29385 [Allocoleopsis sp.]
MHPDQAISIDAIQGSIRPSQAQTRSKTELTYPLHNYTKTAKGI